VDRYDLTFKCRVYAVSTNNAQNIIFLYDVDSFWYLNTTISIMFLKDLLTILIINKSDTGVSDTLILNAYGKYFTNLMCHTDICLCTFGIYPCNCKGFPVHAMTACGRVEHVALLVLNLSTRWR